MAKQLHPDKVPESQKEEARKNFQQVLAAYNVLKDPERRKIYDRTGNVETAEASNIEQFVQAYQYFRDKFPEISMKDIETFEKKYRKSAEEKEDLKIFFLEKEGDVRHILHEIICSRNSDIKRFLKFFDNNISNGESEFTKFKSKYAQTRKKIIKLKDESKEAEEEKKKNFSSLQLAILNKQKERGKSDEGFLSSLMSRYGGADLEFENPGKKKGGKKKKLGKKKKNGSEVLRENIKITNQKNKNGKRNLKSDLKRPKKDRKKVKKIN